MSAKKLIQRVLTEMEEAKSQSFVVGHGPYLLQVATGRPGSICFTLQEDVGPSVKVILAEGFTLGDSIIYDQRTMPTDYIEEIVSDLIDSKFRKDRFADPMGVISTTMVADV